MRAVQVAAAVVRYHLVCAAHGPVGSLPIGRKASPTARRCPVCKGTPEIWVGTTAQVTDTSGTLLHRPCCAQDDAPPTEEGEPV